MCDKASYDYERFASFYCSTIRLCPPLVVDEEDIDKLLDVFEKAFEEDVL